MVWKKVDLAENVVIKGNVVGFEKLTLNFGEMNLELQHHIYDASSHTMLAFGMIMVP